MSQEYDIRESVKSPEETELKKCEGKRDYDLSEFSDPQCVLCDTTKDLVVHHKRYGPHLLKEKDFLVVCQPCHRKLHGIHPPRPPIIEAIELKKTGKEIAAYFPRTNKYLCSLCKTKADFSNSYPEFITHLVNFHADVLRECE